MTRLERDLEQVFVDVAMAEDRDFPALDEELTEAAETFECTFVDVAFAEAGELTETACTGHHQ